jgi:hypothetical protein
MLQYSFLPPTSPEINDQTHSDSRVWSNQVFVVLKHPFNYDSWLVILWVLSKVILEFGPYLREQFFWVHSLWNKDLLGNHFLFRNKSLSRNNPSDSKQIILSEKVSFCVKTATFRNIILFWKNYLRKKLFLSPPVTKQGLVTKQKNVSKKLSFCVKTTLFRNITLFRKVFIRWSAHGKYLLNRIYEGHIYFRSSENCRAWGNGRSFNWLSVSLLFPVSIW